MPSSDRGRLAIIVCAAAAGIAGLGLLLPGLGAHGLWSSAELPVLDRARAALGEPLTGLQRNPWLPDLLRTWAVGVSETDGALRIPHAVAVAALAALAAGLAKARGFGPRAAVVAGLWVLAFPAVGLAGRTALGNPIGELMAVATVVLGLWTCRTTKRSAAIAGALGTAALGAGAVASVGLVYGAVAPLCAIAIGCDQPQRRALATAIWAGAAVALVTAVVLVVGQGDGYIPILGAARDLDLIDKPEARRFADTLQDAGYQVFPWLPMAAIGVLVGTRNRLAGLWLVVTVALACGWGVAYGAHPVPIAVPVALCCAAAAEHIVDPRRPALARRLAVVVVIGGMLVTGKDLDRTPSRVAAPLHDFEGEHHYPAKQLETVAHLGRIKNLAILALLLAAVFGPRRRTDDEADDSPRARVWAAGPWVALGSAALWGAYVQTQVLVPKTSTMLSPRAVLEHWSSLVDSGGLPPSLGAHRIRDRGLVRYGPAQVDELQGRAELLEYLKSPEPRAVLVRAGEVPTLHQRHRQHGWPLYVLDLSHHRLRLLSNVLPPGSVDHNPINAVVFDEPPQLANETLVRFDKYVEIIGWECEQPVIRGRKHTLRLVFRVLRPLPGGTKVYARMYKGRTSRVNREAHPIAGDVYPPNQWRGGDYIFHEYEFEAPTLEILPGTHDFIVALRRGEKKNIDISIPEGKTGDFGVVVRDKKRNFAAIGKVTVW